MAKVGRNDPCPCGSGQKYKRCCLPREEAAERAAAERAATLAREAESSVTYAAIGAEDEGLDDASNSVITLIDAGRLDEAERAAQDLLARYPDVHDGLERLPMVYAARGDRPRAAEYYRKAADFVHAHADQYGPKMAVYLRKRVTEFESPEE
jgi:tetratricopeptide (TPR) repeat protein